MGNEISRFKHYTKYTALLVYFLVSTLLTWPLFFKLGSVLFGDYGDSRGGVWGLWEKSNGLLNTPMNHLIAAPFGMPAERSFSQPVSEWALIVLAWLTNEITAYNLFVFLAFPVTGIATYFLLDRLLHNRISAFVCLLVSKAERKNSQLQIKSTISCRALISY